MEPFLAKGVEDDVVSHYKLLRSCLLKFGGAYVPDFLNVKHNPGNTWKHLYIIVYCMWESKTRVSHCVFTNSLNWSLKWMLRIAA
jgi:hypothetical protein